MKVIIGAGKTAYSGWVTTQEDELNLLNASDFERFFSGELADAMLAEHVWEHLTPEEGLIAAKNCFAFLKPGGYIRCAVPDAFFRNERYQSLARVGGPGPKDHPAHTHKTLYSYKTFREAFERAGFVVELLEYCDEDGRFHYQYWNDADGHIGRSYRFDTRNSGDTIGSVSIIIDAKKPLII